MVSEDRQRVIETNRSLRLIKNELESLLEKGIITDTAFDSITALLPAETPLSGAAATRTPAPATPASTTSLPSQSPAPAPQPPSYAQSTASPPSLPARNPPPATVPDKPVLVHARALYTYHASDARDCSFERDDRIAVHEYMNADWWMGRNLRTGQEGIFPRNYVVVDSSVDEKQQQHPAPSPAAGYYPVAPVPVSGYHAPPPAAPVGQWQGQDQQQQQQQQDGGNSKLGEHGKKFGKKLGNAAIFGAGATIGSNIVNSIF
ncbi:SH3 domain-containing protein [Chaetomium strumarium]|uniref:SH3 domain-containing protein n=1 Tax=Chaetomium strumarium TaxID=1170767 RepID=A0AAJ0H323_9PEZI|nr:SH3 domain-containing protein [Chaetomium strumarium]